MERANNKVEGSLRGTVVTIQQYAYEQKYTWDDYSTIEFHSTPTQSNEYMSLIGIVDIEFYVPPSYDRTQIQVLALKKVREEKIAQFQSVLAELDETIAKMSSLCYDSSAPTVEEDEAFNGMTESTKEFLDATPDAINPENDGFEAN